MIARFFWALTASGAMLVSAPAGAAGILIENVTIIDGSGAALMPGMSVLIGDGLIARIDDSPISAPDDVMRIDGAGKFLIPGLIDTHVHLRGAADPSDPKHQKADRREGEEALASYIYSGVTSIYDAGNDPDNGVNQQQQHEANQETTGTESTEVTAEALVGKWGGYAIADGQKTWFGFSFDANSTFDALIQKFADDGSSEDQRDGGSWSLIEGILILESRPDGHSRMSVDFIGNQLRLQTPGGGSILLDQVN